MGEETIFVVYPSKQEVKTQLKHSSQPFYEFLWTNSALVLRKYLKCTGTDESLVKQMPYPVFEKFKTQMTTDSECDTDFLEIRDQGDIALPDEFIEAIEEASCDTIFNAKTLAKELIEDLRYFKDPELIKVKKSLHKLLKYFKKHQMVTLEEFKYNKVIKEYYQRKDDC
jgi:hypothetical protein